MTLVQPATVTVSEYVPAAAVVTLVMEGFCSDEVNPFGPVHEYVAPLTALVDSERAVPVHTGELLEGEGVAGIGLTVTIAVPAFPVQPPTVAVTEYVPVAAVVAPGMLGFCVDEVNPFGPVHEYVAPPMFDAERFSVLPAQIGLLLEAAGAAGVAFTVTLTVPAALVQPATVIVSEYVPAAAVVTLVMEGFCSDEVNPFGPVHEYVAPATNAVLKLSVVPEHTGLLLESEGAAGVGLTVTLTVPALPVHPATVAVTEYVPDAAVVAPAMLGFCVEDVNPFGPVHEYVAPPMLDAERLSVLPSQIGLLLDAVGAAGIGLTVTLTVPAVLVHPPTVAVTEYVPDAAVVAPVMLGFCVEDVNPFGPVHEYVAPTTFDAERLSVLPAHTGLLLDAVGAAGVVFTVTLTVAIGLAHPPTVAVTEYVPAAAAVTPLMAGFCEDEVNPFGPVHEYIAPTMLDAERFSVDPVHTGLLLEAVGAEGMGFTVTLVVPAGPVHPLTVAVTEYVPASAEDATGIVGFCVVEVNPLGPVHEYVAPEIVPAVRLIGEPRHTGLLLPVTGADGVVTAATVTVAVIGGHPVV